MNTCFTRAPFEEFTSFKSSSFFQSINVFNQKSFTSHLKMAEFKANQSTTKKIVVRRPVNAVPDEIRLDSRLNQWIENRLPSNYNFEVHKIIHRIRSTNTQRVCLQFPEGLLIFSTPLVELLQEFTDARVIVMGDVTYGACCIDDFGASLNNCQLVIHFAHSCLVPLTEMVEGVRALYVFVDIKFDVWHCLQTVQRNFPLDSCEYKKFALASSIQFVSSVHHLAKELRTLGFQCDVPQAKPLSPGEVLGCTSPTLSTDVDAVLFICDGRFHLEAMMIANPNVKAFFKYNPYNKDLTREAYDQSRMLNQRELAIRQTMKLLQTKPNVVIGLVLGTLGHQGSPKVLDNLKLKLNKSHPNCRFLSVLIPEINAKILNSFGNAVDAWVQISCPRLSIDWANDVIPKPLLTPFEFSRALDVSFHHLVDYPMDFYASNSLGNWTPNHKCGSQCSCES